MQFPMMKKFRYWFLFILLFLNSPISAEIPNSLMYPCDDPIKSQHFTFGQLEVKENYLVIWQNDIHSLRQIRLGKLLAESELVGFVADSLINTTSIMSNGDLIKSEIIVTNEAIIREHVFHKFFPERALLCTTVLLSRP